MTHLRDGWKEHAKSCMWSAGSVAFFIPFADICAGRRAFLYGSCQMKMHVQSVWLILLAALSANGHLLDRHAPATKRGEDAGTPDPSSN